MSTSKGLKPAVLIMVALMFAAAVTGCGKSARRTVKVAGSTSVQPLTEELAEAFAQKQPDLTVSITGGGSSAGVESANKGTAQIGTSSRELKDEEKGYGLTETMIAKDGIAVIVNPANPVKDLTLEQIKKIFTGEIKDWREVGGKKGPIIVVVREEGSGTRGAFEEMVLGKGVKFIANAVVQNYTGAVKTAVTKDAGAVGFISLGSTDNTVRALKVDGIAPSEATVLDKSYKISRPFLFLTKGEPDSATKAFIDFVLSGEGQKIVSEKFVKVK